MKRETDTELQQHCSTKNLCLICKTGNLFGQTVSHRQPAQRAHWFNQATFRLGGVCGMAKEYDVWREKAQGLLAFWLETPKRKEIARFPPLYLS